MREDRGRLQRHFHPDAGPDVGIVIELKYADDGNLEAACSEALKQIEEKKYAEGLKRRGTKKIIKYGIAFWEKECRVMMEESNQTG